MSLRFSPLEAAQRGFITEAEAKLMLRKMGEAGASQRGKHQLESPKPAMRRCPRQYDPDANTPQRRLFNALSERLPGRVEWEKKGLVPGRKFAADIFICPNLVVEMDGYEYHRSLEAFQKDRERKNLIEAMGYRVFHAFAGQIEDADAFQRLIDLIVMVAQGETPSREICVAGLLVKKSV